MTEREIEIVQQSMNRIIPLAKETGELFYNRLFEIAPHIRPLFRDDIPNQSRKLMSILIHIVANLDRIEEIKIELKELAQRHIAYDVKIEHYQLLEKVLLFSLENKLANNWNEELKAAWKTAYGEISNAMIDVHLNV